MYDISSETCHVLEGEVCRVSACDHLMRLPSNVFSCHIMTLFFIPEVVITIGIFFAVYGSINFTKNEPNAFSNIGKTVRGSGS